MGQFIVCRRVIELFYKVIDFNENETNINFFDLFHVFQKEKTIKLVYCGKEHLIESFFDEGQMRVKCDGIFYKSTEDFLIKAKFNGKHVYIINYDYDFYELKIIK